MDKPVVARHIIKGIAENAIQNIYHHIQILKDKCDKSSRSHQIIKLMEMEREMNELKRQRDIAQSQLEQEISARKELKARHQIKMDLPDKLLNAFLLRIMDHYPSIIVHEIRKLEMRQRQLGDEANRALELLHKEVVSYKLGSQGSAETVANLLSEIKGMHTMTSAPEEIDLKDKASLGEEIERLNSHESNITTLEQKLENVQRTIERLSTHLPSHEGAPDIQFMKEEKNSSFALSNTSNMQHIIRSPCSIKNFYKQCYMIRKHNTRERPFHLGCN
ncbi:hypothetical protein Leryth_020924 [Lithospermum erythrorhizon]|nr:hypothetical protein Leryth_020924 [Lithospermum erythrorhizon]